VPVESGNRLRLALRSPEAQSQMTRIEDPTAALQAAATCARYLLQQPPTLPPLSSSAAIGQQLNIAREIVGNRRWKRWLLTEVGMSVRIGRQYVEDYLRSLPLTREEYQARLDELNPVAARARAMRARMKAAREAAAQVSAQQRAVIADDG
jgi:hypothetical protein